MAVCVSAMSTVSFKITENTNVKPAGSKITSYCVVCTFPWCSCCRALTGAV